MTTIVHRPILPVGDELVVLDAERRLYVGLNRAGDGYHVIAPADPKDPRVLSEPPMAAAGDLVCTCPGGLYHGRCYRLDQARAFEAGNAAAFRPKTLDELVAVLA